LKQLLEQLRLLEPSVPILRERGVMRDLLIEAQAGKPAPGEMHSQFLDQLAFTCNAIQVADPEDAQQKLWINRWTARPAIAVLQLFAYKRKADCAFRSTVGDDSQELDLPGGSSRTTLPNENVAP
jgi:hypothetical protein